MHLLQSWSFVPKRLFGYIVPVTLLLVVASGFRALFILYHEQGPTGQHLGWQSWDVINGDASVPSGGSSANKSEGKEWWEAETLDAGPRPMGMTLPLDTWAPLLPHSTGCEYSLVMKMNAILLIQWFSIRDSCAAMLLSAARGLCTEINAGRGRDQRCAPSKLISPQPESQSIYKGNG